MIIKGGILHDGLGNTSEADIRTENGLIAEIGTGLKIASPEEEIIDVSGRHVFPGFIDPFTVWGINGTTTEVKASSEDNEELSGPIQPHLETTYAVNGRALAVQQLPAYGITAVGVVPTASNLFGGSMSVFYTDGRINALRSMAARKAAMTISVASQVREYYGAKGMAPMTRMKTLEMFSSTIRSAMSDDCPANDAKLMAVREAVTEKRPFFVYSDDPVSREAVWEILTPYGIDITYLSSDNMTADEIITGAENVSVVLGYDGINMGTPPRHFDPELPVQLRRAGTKVCVFGSGSRSYGRENYMWSAIELMRTVRDPEYVISAMTSVPAKILGIDKVTGCLKQEMRADISIWSGHPLETFQAGAEFTLSGGSIVYRKGDERRCYF